MKALNAAWKAEADLLYGQNFAHALELELAGGTVFLATRNGITIGGQSYDPLLAEVGPVVVSYDALGQGRLVTSRLKVAVDNRVRFGGPSTRFSSNLTADEPEGVRFTLRAPKALDTTSSQIVLAGRVLTVTPNGDSIDLELGDDLAWLEQTVGVEIAGSGTFPFVRNVLWFTPNISDWGKTIPVRYGKVQPGVAGVWIKQKVDLLRSDLTMSATVIDIYRPEIWDPGGGSGFISRLNASTPRERFKYTGVDVANRQLTGVTRAYLWDDGAFTFLVVSTKTVVPNYDNDIDPENIVYGGDVVTDAALGFGQQTYRESSICEVRWSNNNDQPANITINGSTSLPNTAYTKDDGTLVLQTIYGTAAAVGEPQRSFLDTFWDPDVNLRSNQPYVYDHDDATFDTFGDGSGLGSGQWTALIGEGTEHDSGVAGEMESPYNTTWDDRLQGSFRIARSKTESPYALNTWNLDNHPQRFGLEIKYRIVTRGTKTVTRCQVQVHGHEFNVPSQETNNPAHWKQNVDIPVDTDPLGTVITLYFDDTHPQTASFSRSAVNFWLARPHIQWLFGIDYSGAGTNYVIDFIGVTRIISSSGTEDVAVNMDSGGDDDALADLSGVKDDGSGTFTGTPNATIENPADVRRHFIEAVAGLPAAHVDAASFAADRSKYGDDNDFSGSTDSPKDFGPILAEMDFAAQAWTYCAEGKVRSKFRETVATLIAASSDKALTKNLLAGIGGPIVEREDVFRVLRVDTIRPPTPQALRGRSASSLVRRTQPPTIVGHRVGADDIGNQPSAEFDPSLDPSLFISAARIGGSKEGDLTVSTGTNRTIASASADASKALFGTRRSEVFPDIPWLVGVGIANIVLANINKWREDPRMILQGVLGYLDQYELEPGDLVTVAWPDEEGGFVYPQLNGAKKFLVLPTPAMEPSVGRMGRVNLTLIQVDL